jgi:Ca2+-binding RTX toxin-like protein
LSAVITIAGVVVLLMMLPLIAELSDTDTIFGVSNSEAISQLEASGYTIGGQWTDVPPGTQCNGLDATLYGIASAGDDPTTFYGTDGPDVIVIDTDGVGDPDKAWVWGHGGNDTICIEATDDAMVWGGPGDDWIQGNNGEDWLKGQNGADTIFGAGAADNIWGGQGDDIISGGGSGDSLWGDEGNDTITGESGEDYIFGGDGDDSINCGTGTEDFADGGEGTDTEAGTPGNCETTQNME